MISLALYPIYMGDVPPHYTLQKEFSKHFSPFFVYDWVNIAKKIGLPKTQANFIDILKERKPEYTFMQLQNPINMNVKTVVEMAKYTKILNWSGDIRQMPEWYKWFKDIGKEIHLTLFSNETDVDILTAQGVRADYLQCGVDTAWYYPRKALPNYPEIVFCCNDYGNFQLSPYRVQVVKALKAEFGERFQIYGGGWEKHGIKTKWVDNKTEADLYASCKIAISVSNFDFKRYYSDRLLRIMACGAFPMSHEFECIEKDYGVGKNIMTFRDTTDLIEKCHYYLNNKNERNEIAAAALEKSKDTTWGVRAKELIQVLDKWK